MDTPRNIWVLLIGVAMGLGLIDPTMLRPCFAVTVAMTCLLIIVGPAKSSR